MVVDYSNFFVGADNGVPLQLRDFQAKACVWMIENCKARRGSLLAHEMGLGKTCQAICALKAVSSLADSSSKRFQMVVVPLSVIDQWKIELEKWARSILHVIVYMGRQNSREMIADDILSVKTPSQTVILTTYEYLLRDASVFFDKLRFDCVVLDEAHRLKNHAGELHSVVKHLNCNARILLTGTPVQNNLSELYSLLSLLDSSKFDISNSQDFVEKFQPCLFGSNDKALKNEFSELLKPYLNRLTKTEANLSLPPIQNVLLYHDLTSLQKDLYKGILAKNIDSLLHLGGNKENGHTTSFNNLLMNLRKCVSHPYLFDGVEPEPFVDGEHIITASAKLILLDKLLAFLEARGHLRVLVFSQMTRFLDIIQDFLHVRAIAYERLDGSVRSEERQLAIKGFGGTGDSSSAKLKVFLLSTKAGGIGLNLVSADTVILADPDFNPQNDEQAASRAHRMGQNKPVSVIRLIGQHTVEENIMLRAVAKMNLAVSTLKLAEDQNRQPVSNGSSSKNSNDAEISANSDWNSMLKFGLDKLLAASDDKSDIDLEQLLGHTDHNGHWMFDQGSDITNNASQKRDDQITDEDMLRNLVDPLLRGIKEIEIKRKPVKEGGLSVSRKPRPKPTPLTAQQKAENARQALAKKWAKLDYQSMKLVVDDDDDDFSIAPASDTKIDYATGDVTQPIDKFVDGDVKVVVQLIDNSGVWGHGGVFAAIATKFPEVVEYYELSKKASNLALDDVHLIQISKSLSIALLIVQKRQNPAPSVTSLGKAFSTLSRHAKRCDDHSFTLHFSRAIAHKNADVGGVNSGDNDVLTFYSYERLIRKYFTSRGIASTIYYFKRNLKRQVDDNDDGTDMGEQTDVGVPAQLSSSSPTSTDDIFANMHFALDKFTLTDATIDQLSRYLVAYGGEIDDIDEKKATNVDRLTILTDLSSCDFDLAMIEGQFAGDDGVPAICDIEWIIKSVKSGKLLDVKDFAVEKT